MALSMWGQQIIQAVMPQEAPVQVGTIWVDTSGTATAKICTSVSPYTFATITGTSYTDEEAQDAVGSILVDGATIDFTYNDGVPSITAEVKAVSISDSHIAVAAAIAWSKISKVGSSLADLATRSAADLSSGTLPLARLVGITNTEIAAGAAIVATKLDLSAGISVGSASLSAGTTAGTFAKSTAAAGTTPTVRAQGYSPSFELLDKDNVQNWYFGINDDDSDALYIGRGYGPNQGIAPAIKVLKADDTVVLAADLVVGDGKGVRRNTSNGSDNGYISFSGGGAVNDATRGGSLTLFGNEFGSGFGGHAQFVCGDHADGKIRLYRGDLATMLEIANSVDSISIPKGQLKFPASANASADSNTLDDYEEGTFSSTITGASGTAGGYAAQNGMYVKWGSAVAVWFDVQLSSVGSLSGNISVGGFPFSTHGSLPSHQQNVFWSSVGTNFIHVSATLSASNSAFILSATTAAFTSFQQVIVQGSDLGASSLFRGHFTYRA